MDEVYNISAGEAFDFISEVFGLNNDRESKDTLMTRRDWLSNQNELTVEERETVMMALDARDWCWGWESDDPLISPALVLATLDKPWCWSELSVNPGLGVKRHLVAKTINAELISHTTT